MRQLAICDTDGSSAHHVNPPRCHGLTLPPATQQLALCAAKGSSAHREGPPRCYGLAPAHEEAAMRHQQLGRVGAVLAPQAQCRLERGCVRGNPHVHQMIHPPRGVG